MAESQRYNLGSRQRHRLSLIHIFVKTVKEKALCKKACKTLFSYIKNTIYSARVNKAIVGDPMEFLQAKQFYQYCVEKEKPLEQKIFSDLDLNSLHERFDLDHEKKPDYIPTYADVYKRQKHGCHKSQ